MGLFVNVRKKLDGFTLDASWETDSGITVMSGPSGAGKSMTLQMIAGLITPDEGRIELGGRPLFDSERGINLRPQERSIGYVFQDLALFPHMTVMENILFGAKGIDRSRKRRKAEEMIGSFRLCGLEQRLPSEISGGQKQRVALARAIVGRPELLLLDEPFSALDNETRSEMRQYIRGLQNAVQIPMVLVTHDVEDARELARKVITYCEGKCTDNCFAEKLFFEKSHPAYV